MVQRWDDIAPDDLDPDDVDADPLQWADTAGRWRRRVMAAFVVTVVAVVGAVAFDEFALLWWSRQAADLADAARDDGRNVGAGLGAACTLFSFMLLAAALRRHTRRRMRVHLVAGAIVVSAPTALTAAVAYGNGSDAAIARVLLEADAPAFVDGTVAGVGGATMLMVALAVGIPAWRFYWARQQGDLDDDLPPGEQ
jgi:hypothetical protein